MLRDRHGGDADFRLADYFDLIGGTSTGAIIATSLAKGMSVDETDLSFSEEEVKQLREMDEAENLDKLIKVGEAVAEQVEESQFPAAFDLST